MKNMYKKAQRIDQGGARFAWCCHLTEKAVRMTVMWFVNQRVCSQCSRACASRNLYDTLSPAQSPQQVHEGLATPRRLAAPVTGKLGVGMCPCPRGRVPDTSDSVVSTLNSTPAT